MTYAQKELLKKARAISGRTMSYWSAETLLRTAEQMIEDDARHVSI
jgi:uncharacterized protein (DUF1778 family)